MSSVTDRKSTRVSSANLKKTVAEGVGRALAARKAAGIDVVNIPWVKRPVYFFARWQIKLYVVHRFFLNMLFTLLFRFWRSASISSSMAP